LGLIEIARKGYDVGIGSRRVEVPGRLLTVRESGASPSAPCLDAKTPVMASVTREAWNRPHYELGTDGDHRPSA
jgi:hypothetical protein